MSRIVIALACVLLPSQGFGQEFVFRETCTPRRAVTATPVPTFRLFPTQAAATGPQSAPTPSSKPNRRPHMIELNSANWRPLKTSEKAAFVWHDMLNWGTHVSLAFDAGLSFATEDRPYLGNGTRGFFTRYGLNAADEVNFTFFNAFFFPTLFHQDPRYIPLDKGKTSVRVAYAISRVLLTRNDSGATDVNRSRLAGNFVATAISSIMYSSYGADVGIGGNFTAFGLNLAADAGFDVFKEFWPDVARKMKLNLWLRNLVRASVRDYVRIG